MIDKLKDIITIIMPDNTFLSEVSKKILDAEEFDQQSLKTLKQFRNVYQLLQSVLQKPYKELPYALWTYQLPSDMSSIETKFTRIVQYILTDYSNKSNRSTEYAIKGERTFWIDRVVPLLQTLGDQTGFISFEWCETVADEQMESNTVPECWIQGNVRYLDGLGYDRKGRSKIVMESSSGPTAEKTDHTLNDTIKNMHNSIALLEAVVRRNQYACFVTLTKVRAFSLQLVCTTLTLSTTRLDPDSPGKCIVQQHRYADLPILWYKVFELLALLTTMLEEQTMIIDELHVESSGSVDITKEEYVCKILSKLSTIPP
ncbi:hypothetical protein CLU79DRAFT_857508 [Phycomyces nitens]|nr:hypothetical protein CLU79DRAFT_857508 [Phycomyces nitens]